MTFQLLGGKWRVVRKIFLMRLGDLESSEMSKSREESKSREIHKMA